MVEVSRPPVRVDERERVAFIEQVFTFAHFALSWMAGQVDVHVLLAEPLYRSNVGPAQRCGQVMSR